MKFAAVLALLAGSAAAFAPSQQASRSSTSLAAYDDALGVQKPLGFWDPLNFLDGADEARFERLRFVEVKHGRIAMLAVLGHITTTAGIRLGGDIDYSGTSYSSIKSGIAGLSDIPTAGLAQIIAFIGFLEVAVMTDKGKGEFPGDLRNGMFGWKGSAEDLMEKRSIELNNGRAAQMGILGLMVHEQLSGEPYVINSLLGYPSGFNVGL